MVEQARRHPLQWVSSLYFMQGLPYALVTVLSLLFYKAFGLSNAYIAVATSVIALPWAIKPLFTPWGESRGTKAGWSYLTECLGGVLILILALSLSLGAGIATSLVILTLIAMTSACHDIASDGVYLMQLNEQVRLRYLGVRVLSYQLARVVCVGAVPLIVGFVAVFDSKQFGWQVGLSCLGIMMFALGIYHAHFLTADNRAQVATEASQKNRLGLLQQLFKQFLALPNSFLLIVFLFFYNCAESQLIKIVPLFLIDPHAAGGMGLTEANISLVFGVVGTAALVLGALASGYLNARFGLRRCLQPMTILMVLCNSVYLFAGWGGGNEIVMCSAMVAIAQFGFGMSSTVYMGVLVESVAGRPFQASLYAIGTAVMALGMVLLGALSGSLQQWLGYHGFFIEVLAAGVCVNVLAYWMKRKLL